MPTFHAHGLEAAKGTAIVSAKILEHMTACPERRAQRIVGGERRLNGHHATLAIVEPARAVASLLRVHAAVQERLQHLRVALRLHVATHETIGHDNSTRAVVPLNKRRNDGVVRALGWRVRVGVTRR